MKSYVVTALPLSSTAPQCLYPLVSRPLEDVLAQLVPMTAQTGVKRKNGHVLPSEDVAAPAPKRLRSHRDEQGPEAADPLVPEEEPRPIDGDGTGLTVLRDACEEALWGTPPSKGPLSSEAACPEEGAKDQGGDVLVPTCSPTKPTAGETALSSAGPLSPVGGFGMFGPASTGFAPRHASVVQEGTPGDVLSGRVNGPLHDALQPRDLDSNQGGVPVEDLVECILALAPAGEPMVQKPQLLDGEGTSVLAGATTTSEQADLNKSLVNVSPRRAETGPPKEKLVALPPRLFWKNSENLCWLDALLVALVNCRSLRDHGPGDRAPKSPIWELITKYDEVCAAVQAHQLTGKGEWPLTAARAGELTLCGNNNNKQIATI